MKLRYFGKSIGKIILAMLCWMQISEAYAQFMPTEQLVDNSEYIVVAKVQTVSNTDKMMRWREVSARVVKNKLQVVEMIKDTLSLEKLFTLNTLKFDGWMEDNVELPSKGSKVLLFLKQDEKGELKPVNGIQGVWPMHKGELIGAGSGTTLKQIREMVQNQENRCHGEVSIPIKAQEYKVIPSPPKAKELLQKARKLWNDGKLQQAIAKVAQAQKLAGKEKKIAKTLKAMQMQKKDLDSKLKEAERLITKDKLKEAEKVLVRASRISDKYKKYKEVLKKLANAKKKDEDNKKKLVKVLKKAKALKNAGKLDKAAKVLKKIAKEFPGNREINKLLKEVQKLQNNAHKKLKKGQKQWKDGLLDEAVSTMKEAAGIDSSNRQITKVLKGMQGQKKMMDDSLTKANKLIEEKKFGQVERVLKKAGRINSMYLPYVEMLKKLYLAEKKAEQKKKDERLARKKAEAERIAAKKQHTDARKKMAEGQKQWRSGILDKAVSILKESVRIDPSNRQIAKVLKAMQGQKKMMDDSLIKADKLIEEKKYDQAEIVLKKAGRINGKYLSYVEMLKKFDLAKRKAEQRKKQLVKLLKDAKVFNDAGKLDEAAILLEEGNRRFLGSKKIETLLKEVQKQQSDAYRKMKKGEFQWDSGALDDGILTLKEAAKINPLNIQTGKDLMYMQQKKKEINDALAKAGRLIGQKKLNEAHNELKMVEHISSKYLPYIEAMKKYNSAKSRGNEVKRILIDAKRKWQREDEKGAIFNLSEILEIEPGHEEAISLKKSWQGIVNLRMPAQSNIKGGVAGEDHGVDNPASITLALPNIERLKSQCEIGDMQGCYKVGLVYFGKGELSREEEQRMTLYGLARSFFELSCEGEVYRGCARAAGYYAGKKEPDYQKAKAYAEKACDHNVGIGCDVLASLYGKRRGVPLDSSAFKHYMQKTVELFKLSCQLNRNEHYQEYGRYQDIAFACGKLGLIYDGENSKGLIEKDEKKSEAYYQKACELQNNNACFMLAIIYESKQNMKKSIKYYTKLCERGAGSCQYIALLYDIGDDGIDRDPEKVKKYYQKACEYGDEDACRSAKRDPDFLEAPDNYSMQVVAVLNSFSLYKNECKKGNIKGCIGVGACYIYGKGVKQDFKTAKKFFNLACESNNARGCYGVGVAYEKLHQIDTAILQYELSCKMGFKLGCKWTKKLKKDK